METHRVITVKMLENIFSRIISKLKFNGISDIELTDDFYKIISTYEWSIVPDDIVSVGSLFDDFDSLNKAISQEEVFLTYVDFDRTASLLRYISEKINPVNG